MHLQNKKITKTRKWQSKRKDGIACQVSHLPISTSKSCIGRGRAGSHTRVDQDLQQIEGIRKSGVVNTGCLDAVAEAIRPGMNTQEIDDICMQYCKDHDAIPACLNYEGYPKSVCTSINEVVCHGIPKEEDVLQEGDIVNVDMTTIVDGYYADASRMFIVGGKTTPEKEQLVRVAKECLEIGMEVAKPYSFVGDIGHAIENHCKKYGYGVVRDLCGHGVGLQFHEEPEVLHYGHKGTGMLLVPGMVFTIEIYINMGTCSWLSMPTTHTDGKLSLATRSHRLSGSIHSS